jgi:hypothetical protein
MQFCNRRKLLKKLGWASIGCNSFHYGAGALPTSRESLPITQRIADRQLFGLSNARTALPTLFAMTYNRRLLIVAAPAV